MRPFAFDDVSQSRPLIPVSGSDPRAHPIRSAGRPGSRRFRRTFPTRPVVD